MKARSRYLIIAVSLTILDVAVLVCYGWPAWTTSSDDLSSRGILVLLAALGASSLANVWAQMDTAQNDLPGRQSADNEQTPVPIRAQARGEADV